MKKAASIFLRADMRPVDVQNLADWMENRDVTRYLNEEECAAEQLQELLETVPAPMLTYHFNQQGRFFMVCDAADRSSIGFVKLKKQADCRSDEIVFAIGDDTLWGNGYGSQAVRAAEAQAFLDWRAKKLTAKIYHGNSRSARTVRRCGFREERKLEELSCYSITQEEYFDLLLEKKRA